MELKPEGAESIRVSSESNSLLHSPDRMRVFLDVSHQKLIAMLRLNDSTWWILQQMNKESKTPTSPYAKRCKTRQQYYLEI